MGVPDSLKFMNHWPRESGHPCDVTGLESDSCCSVRYIISYVHGLYLPFRVIWVHVSVAAICIAAICVAAICAAAQLIFFFGRTRLAV